MRAAAAYKIPFLPLPVTASAGYRRTGEAFAPTFRSTEPMKPKRSPRFTVISSEFKATRPPNTRVNPVVWMAGMGGADGVCGAVEGETVFMASKHYGMGTIHRNRVFFDPRRGVNRFNGGTGA